MKDKFLVKPLRSLPKERESFEIGDRIEFLRCILGFPVPAFARKFGTTTAAMENVLYKRKLPTIKLIQAIPLVLGADGNWVVSNIGEPYPTKDYSAYIYTEPQSKINDEYSSIAKRLKEVRVFFNLTLAKFANALDESLDYVASIEYGRQRATIAYVNKVIVKFGILDPWMWRGEGEMRAKKGRG